MFLHSHYEIFRSTGARRPSDKKSSRPRLGVSAPFKKGGAVAPCAPPGYAPDNYKMFMYLEQMKQ